MGGGGGGIGKYTPYIVFFEKLYIFSVSQIKHLLAYTACISMNVHDPTVHPLHVVMHILSDFFFTTTTPTRSNINFKETNSSKFKNIKYNDIKIKTETLLNRKRLVSPYFNSKNIHLDVHHLKHV